MPPDDDVDAKKYFTLVDQHVRACLSKPSVVLIVMVVTSLDQLESAPIKSVLDEVDGGRVRTVVVLSKPDTWDASTCERCADAVMGRYGTPYRHGR